MAANKEKMAEYTVRNYFYSKNQKKEDYILALEREFGSAVKTEAEWNKILKNKGIIL